MRGVQATSVVTPHEVLDDVTIWIDDGRIVDIISDAGDAVARSRAGAQIDANGLSTQLIDARGLTIFPGLIDIHTHGADGVQAIDGTLAAHERMARFYARHGVTGFLAGIFGSREQIEAGIDAAVEYMEQCEVASGPPTGAELLGIYLEGPFLDPDWAGAFVPDTIIEPNVEILLAYIERAKGSLRLLTLAPELPGAEDLIALAHRHGVVCALGHSGATFAQALASAEIGVRHVTHAFNAMPGIHHRVPGALGEALTDDRVTVEIIADGVHVHPAAVRLLLRAKRPEDVVLITDSVAGAGLPDGDYAFRDVEARVEGGKVRLADGTLAGSTLTMEKGVANLMNYGSLSLAHAVAMATINPARVINLDHRKGRLSAGFDADLVAVTPEFEVAWTMVGGQLVHQGSAQK